MTGEIILKPGCVDAQQLEFFEQFSMTDNIETLAKVNETKNGEKARICSSKDAVGDAREGGLGRVPRTEAMLGWGEEMVGGKVVVELALNCPLHYFGKDWDDRNRTVVGRIGRITGLVDGMDEGMLPGFREDIGDEGEVDDMEEDVTDGVEG